MRWSRWIVSLTASLAGITAGAAPPEEAETNAGREPATGLETSGFSASGPSFYVWEENARQGRRWAAELSHSVPRAPRRSGSDEPNVSQQPTL
jgi:hypothetical protein